MEKYQIIPRKFRPQLFSEVVGHSAIVTTLKNALREDRLAQAYLFAGARGCGKTTLARLLAKALNCTQRSPEGEPCNTCTSCKEILAGQSLNVLEIDGASNRGIDDIREINETVGYAPSRGGYKIYIIDEVHMLTKEAFNALLKTLEEPPKHVKFFFATTEPHKIPQTILSRCQRFDLNRVSAPALIEKLKRIAGKLNLEIEEEAFLQISQLSEGSLRDAESLLDQLICHGKSPITGQVVEGVFGLLSKNLLTRLDQAIEETDLNQAFTFAEEIYGSGADILTSIDRLLEHFRAHLASQLGMHQKQSTSSYTQDHLLYILDTLIDWQQHMRKAPFKQVHLEMLLLQLIRSKHRTSLDNLVQRLLELEKKLPQSERTALAQTVASEPIQQKKAPVEQMKSPSPPSSAEKTEVLQKEESSVEKAVLANTKHERDNNAAVILEKEPHVEQLVPSNSEHAESSPPHSPDDKSAVILETESPVELVAPSTTEHGENSFSQPLAETIVSPSLEAPIVEPQNIETLAAEPKAPEQNIEPQKQKIDAPHPSKDDTLIRFAAIELEGTVH